MNICVQEHICDINITWQVGVYMYLYLPSMNDFLYLRERRRWPRVCFSWVGWWLRPRVCPQWGWFASIAASRFRLVFLFKHVCIISWSHLEAILTHLEAILNHLEATLKPSWPILRQSWIILKPSWPILTPSWTILKQSWTILTYIQANLFLSLLSALLVYS